jgi:hypothetical protein
MKRWVLGLLTVCLTQSGVGLALDHCPGDNEQVLSSCEQYPPFDPADVQRESHGDGAYDRIFFDLNYLVKEQVLLILPGGLDGAVTTQTVTKTLPQSQHFEISEQYGNEATLAAQIQTYLKGRQIYLCP